MSSRILPRPILVGVPALSFLIVILVFDRTPVHSSVTAAAAATAPAPPAAPASERPGIAIAPRTSSVPGAVILPRTVLAPEADPAEESAAEALEVLSPRVTRRSHEGALRMAFEAYYSYRTANPERVRKPYLYYVDLGLDNGTARGYVFDMDALTVVDGPFTVAHGSGSSSQRNGVPTTFSNRPGSRTSSLGLYLAQETYTFRGKSGGRAYRSVGLRMRGESGRFNDAARARGIVAHGAPYVTRSSAGRSQGCPAMEQQRASRLLPLLSNGGVVFVFSPNDENWLSSDPWIHA